MSEQEERGAAVLENAEAFKARQLLVQDRAVSSELVAIGKQKYRGRLHPLNRRSVYQVWHHLETLVDFAFSFRDAERKAGHLDNVSALTEFIYHVKQAQAHLRRVSLRLYAKQPEDLSTYK